MFSSFLDPTALVVTVALHEALLVGLAVVALMSPSRRKVAFRLIAMLRWRPGWPRRRKKN